MLLKDAISIHQNHFRNLFYVIKAYFKESKGKKIFFRRFQYVSSKEKVCFKYSLKPKRLGYSNSHSLIFVVAVNLKKIVSLEFLLLWNEEFWQLPLCHIDYK